MDGKSAKQCSCRSDALETEGHSHRKHEYYVQRDGVYKLLIFGCLFSTLSCFYLLNNAWTTRHQVDILQTTVDRLDIQLRDVLAVKTDQQATRTRRKRAIPAVVRARLPAPLVDGFDIVTPSRVTRPAATAWRRPTFPNVRTTTTARPRVIPTVTTSTSQRNRYLPAEAAHTPNLVTSPDVPEPEAGPSGYRGYSSSQSIRGNDGAPGTPGSPSFDGAPGNGGFDGQPGADGNSGRDGTPGFDGQRGPAGAAGPAGAPGNNVGGNANRSTISGTPGPFFSSRGSPRTASTGSGATFTRWGKVSCPQSTTLVYSGYAAANHPWYSMGGSSELECLSTYPSWPSNSQTTVQTTTKLFAAKFYLGSHTGIFDQAADNSVITCAVCLTAKAPVITIPGRISCPFGWYREYDGYLMSSAAVRYQMFFASRNYCVDQRPDYYQGHQDTNGFKLTFLQAGSCYQNKSPCTQYVENSRMGCAVCSKVSS